MTNPYPASFLRLLDRVGPDARVLDVGSGGRGLPPQVTGLEYVPHPNNSVQADALALPFRDAWFDLVQCQAVLEHVTDPQLAVDEMVRVLRPGGFLYIEVAFMQPLHQAPLHFFNHTVYGLAHLCRDVDVVEKATLGTIEDQFEWIFREAGMPEEDRAIVAECTRRLDATITPEQRISVASGVSIMAIKPGAEDTSPVS